MTPDEIAIFNARIKLENSLNAGTTGFNPVDPALNLNNAYSAPSAVGSNEMASQKLAAQQQALSNAYKFSPDAPNGLTSNPSTPVSQSGYGSSNSASPLSQSLAGTQVPKPQSLGTQVGSSLANLGAGLAGTYLGTKAGEAAWQSNSGIGSQVGGAIGSVVGGLLGTSVGAGTTAGIGAIPTGIAGTAFGGFLGSFIGSGFDALGGLFFGSNKANPHADKGKNYTNPVNVSAPLTSGGVAGVAYSLFLSYDVHVNGAFAYRVTDNGAYGLIAPYSISGLEQVGTQVQITLTSGTGLQQVVPLVSGNGSEVIGLSTKITRSDGQPDTGYKESPNLSGYVPSAPAPSGAFYDGSPFDALEPGEKYIEGTGKREPKPVPDSTKPSPDKPRKVTPNGTPSAPPVLPSPLAGSNPAYPSPSSPSSPASSSGSSSSAPRNFATGTQPAYESPAFSSKPYISGISDPSDYGKEIDNVTGKERVKNPTVDPLKAAPVVTPTPKPNTPNNPSTDNYDTAKILGGIAAVAGTVTALKIGSDLLVNNSLSNTPKIDQIADNTTPTAQQTNSKQGICDAMQPSQCGYEGVKQATEDATNPLKTILENLANILAPFIAFSQSAFGKILSILNNQVVDRTLAVMNLATNIHNAAMLTRDIGETLGSVVDNVVSLSPLRFTNSEGSQVQFTDFIGSNFRSFLISVLGAENYVSLVINWQKANTIYHSAMGVLNTTQSMIDPLSSAVEYGMENVSKIGNSLKEDGVVSENAYPAMDETIRARRVNRFERLNDTLEGAENIASNLSNITSSAVSIKEDYKQLREDAKDLKDKAAAFNTADATARAELKASLPTDVTSITLAPAPAEDEEP